MIAAAHGTVSDGSARKGGRRGACRQPSSAPFSIRSGSLVIHVNDATKLPEAIAAAHSGPFGVSPQAKTSIRSTDAVLATLAEELLHTAENKLVAAEPSLETEQSSTTECETFVVNVVLAPA